MLINPLFLMEQTCELASGEQWLTVPVGSVCLERLRRNSLTSGSAESPVKGTGCFITLEAHGDVAGPSQCDVWREWPSGAPGFQAPVPKVQVEAIAEVGPLALRCIL